MADTALERVLEILKETKTDLTDEKKLLDFLLQELRHDFLMANGYEGCHVDEKGWIVREDGMTADPHLPYMFTAKRVWREYAAVHYKDAKILERPLYISDEFLQVVDDRFVHGSSPVVDRDSFEKAYIDDSKNLIIVTKEADREAHESAFYRNDVAETENELARLYQWFDAEPFDKGTYVIEDGEWVRSRDA